MNRCISIVCAFALFATFAHAAYAANATTFKAWRVSFLPTVTEMQSSSGDARLLFRFETTKDCLYNAGLQLPWLREGQIPVVSTAVDGRPLGYTAGTLIKHNGALWLQLDTRPAGPDGLKRIQRGTTLTVLANGRSHAFSLAGSFKAIEASTAPCRKHRGEQAPTATTKVRPPRKGTPRTSRPSANCRRLIEAYYGYCDNTYLTRPHPNCANTLRSIAAHCPVVARSLGIR